MRRHLLTAVLAIVGLATGADPGDCAIAVYSSTSARPTASTARATSSGEVRQLQTLTRMARRPCHVVPPK